MIILLIRSLKINLIRCALSPFSEKIKPVEKVQKIKTINNFFETRLKEKGSVFIAQSYPANSVEEVELKLKEIRKKYFDATHRCFAYRLAYNQFKYSDDGEPNGTAGVRILNAIDHFELTNILLIVIRYFGGTKLGVGPLGKAYYNSALQTLEAADKIEKENYSRLTIAADFSLLNEIHRLIASYKSILKNSTYDNLSHFEILVRNNAVQQFSTDVIEISKGKIEVEILEDGIFI